MSPAVQELQKELFVASIVAAEQCAGDVRALCGSPDIPQLAVEPFVLGHAEDEDANSISASFVFFRKEGSVRSLASAASRVARRKLFVVVDGEDRDHKDHEHKRKENEHRKEHEHMDHDHGDDHEHKKRPCHRHGLSQQPVKYGFGSSRDQCLHDLVISQSPDVSDSCKAAVADAETINQQINDEIMMEEMAEQLAGLLFFFGLSLLSISLLSCALGSQRQNRHLRRSIITAVYEDPEIKAAVEAKTGLTLGTVPPIRQTSSQGEKCGCSCFLRSVCRALFFFFLTMLALHVFFFFPLSLPVFLGIMLFKACRGRPQTSSAYPASLDLDAGDAVELQEVEATETGKAVYVGVPTKVV